MQLHIDLFFLILLYLTISNDGLDLMVTVLDIVLLAIEIRHYPVKS